MRSGSACANPVSEPGEGGLHFAREAGPDRFPEIHVALPEDLVHDRRLHPCALQLGEGLPRLNPVELLLVPHQHHAGKPERGWRS